MRPHAAIDAPRFELAMLVLSCAAGLAAFVTLAATACAKRACASCGNVTLHGMGCCHELDLGVGDTVGLRTMTFRKTYLVANLLAATCATLVVVTWNL
jgi:hypothetical protein